MALRPPLGVYNLSVETVARRLARVLQGIRAVQGDSRNADLAEDLLEAQESLLHGLMQHMEECTGILMGFSPDDRAFKKSPVAKAYGSQVREYRTHIGKVVNRIKHNQGRLRFVSASMRERPDIWWCGYFVEGASATGGVGPDPTVHGDAAGVFSFNRDLRRHLCELLFTSQALANAVAPHTAVGTNDGPNRPDAENLLSLIEAVVASPEIYFPDEYEEPRPTLDVKQGTEGKSLLVEMRKDESWRPFAGRFIEVRVNFRGDGVTRRWGLPVRPVQQD
jgi:hypothetical protein